MSGKGTLVCRVGVFGQGIRPTLKYVRDWIRGLIYSYVGADFGALFDTGRTPTAGNHPYNKCVAKYR